MQLISQSIKTLMPVGKTQKKQNKMVTLAKMRLEYDIQCRTI